MNSGSPPGTEGLLRLFSIVTLMHSHSVKCEHCDLLGFYISKKESLTCCVRYRESGPELEGRKLKCVPLVISKT